MKGSVLKYALAALAALLVLPFLEAFFFFVVSGGPQSVRGGLHPGHIEKYLGIWLSLASWTIVIVAIAGATVLSTAKLIRRFSAWYILGISVPVGVGLGVAFLLVSGSNATLEPAVWMMSAFCSAVAALTFCLIAGVPWRFEFEDAKS